MQINSNIQIAKLVEKGAVIVIHEQKKTPRNRSKIERVLLREEM